MPETIAPPPQGSPLANGESKRTRHERLRAQLDSIRAPRVIEWRDVNDYILPGRGRFQGSDINQRISRRKIIDPTGTMAARTLSAGFMAHMTSPAREWKELTIPEDPDLAKWGPAKEWLERVRKDMADIHRACGLYKTLPTFYEDAGGFGTGAFMVQEDLTRGRVMKTHPFAVGSYYLFNDPDGRVCGFLRVFQMSVRQVVARFGRRGFNGQPDWSNISSYVQSAWAKGDYENLVEVVHIIHPNPDFNPRLALAKYKKYADCYYETGAVSGSTQGNYMMTAGEDDRYLQESGHDFFPILAGRWAITDGDAYGTDCPGLTGIGAIKALQVREKMIARGEEKGINPAMIAHPALRTTKASTLPGDITYDPSPEGKGFRKAHDIEFDLQFSEQKQQQVRAIINEAFYKNLFLSVSSDTRNDRGTAYEWGLRKQEEFAVLGPVVENFSFDVLDPLVDISFALMIQQKRVPPPPRELQGRMLGVRYVSSMAQAQKATGLNGIERFLGIAGAIAKTTGDVRFITSKVNLDNTLEEVGDMTGVPAKMIRDEEETQAIRQADAEAQQRAMQAEQAANEAKAAKDLSAAKTGDDSALTQVISAAQGQAGQ